MKPGRPPLDPSLLKTPFRRRQVNRKGRVIQASRIIAEQALGKPLPKGVEVHHHTDMQLVICENHAYHRLLHIRTRVVEAGGNPNTEAICVACRQLKALTEFSPNAYRARMGRDGRHHACKACRVAESVARKRQQREAARMKEKT
jgi:hypothetical protein